MGPIKQLNRVVHKVADKIMMTIVGNDSTYIYNVSWVHLPPTPVTTQCHRSTQRRVTANASMPAFLVGLGGSSKT
jgi:hypothetical protein